MAVKKNATEAAEAAEKGKTVNNTTNDKKTDSGADSEATGGGNGDACIYRTATARRTSENE